MSMGAIVTVHYVIPDEAVNKVLGDLAKEHIDTINEFFKIDGVLDDCGREDFVNNELDWSRDHAGDGLFEDDSYGEEAEQMFKKLCEQRTWSTMSRMTATTRSTASPGRSTSAACSSGHRSTRSSSRSTKLKPAGRKSSSSAKISDWVQLGGTAPVFYFIYTPQPRRIYATV